MPGRRQCRTCALQILYMMDAAQMGAEEAIRSFRETNRMEDGLWEYAEALVNGFDSRRAEVDAAIESRSLNWRMYRMPVVDRNILRIAVYEMLFREDVPAKVSIDEAIELAKKFGAEESRAFINGILDRVYNDAGCDK
jgi:N utilization substance protein B